MLGNAAVVELKAVDQMSSVLEAQLITYLKLTGLRLGLLITLIKDGIHRIALQ